MEWSGKGTVRAGISLNTFDLDHEPKMYWGGFKAFSDGEKLTSGTSTWGAGTFGVKRRLPGEPFIKIETDGKTPAILRSLKLRPTGTEPLFTGKNLDGWKVNAADPKRAASKWDVTKDGELSVKNGPGDLVTEKEFDNFVLQFECKTNGKAAQQRVLLPVHSGAVPERLRSADSERLQGRRPHQARGLRHGRVYRRVPARKVVSNDNEWFTMTVVADGKHRDVGERLPDRRLDRRPQGERQPANRLPRREGADLHSGPRPDHGHPVPQHPDC